ncbi:Reverse transcriptase [Theobroma cacao]|nr:Reverse transcriptase [Theobroma cacao]
MEIDALPIDKEPITYEEAISDIDSDKWLKAIKSKMDAMHVNQVWTLVDAPERVKPIGCKWVFKRKTDMDGNVQTYKARLVAKMDVKIAFLNENLQKEVYMTQPEDSTIEAEYISAFEVAKEEVWIKKFVTKLGVVLSIVDPVTLYCDNNGAIAQAKEPRSGDDQMLKQGAFGYGMKHAKMNK